MNWQGAFKVIIRVIFIFAYIAFLAASIRHVATFFHNFEADPTDWANPYTLAVSIDLTALVLTVGVMFFRGNMPWYAQMFTWIFIVALTAFSWFVNWEYARTFQGNDLHVDDNLRMLNPILASSFAFLNLAYSVVAEFFSSKKKTAAELAQEVDELEELELHQTRLAEYKERNKKESVIQRVKKTAIEAREAVSEVVSGTETSTPDPQPVAPVVSQPVAKSVTQASTPVLPVTPVPVEVDSVESDTFSDVESGSFSSMIGGSGSDTEVEPLEEDSDILSDTGDHEAVEVPVTPRSRITVDLSGSRRDTDKLDKAPRKAKPVAQKMTDREKFIRKALAKYPSFNDTQIANKVQMANKIEVSRSYVAKIRGFMQEESKQPALVN